MTISKAHWDTEGDNVRISMPFSKVDQERRIVSGFATLDNVDKQSDIVTTEASLKAFAKFRGNIREMHQPVSVGKMVSFTEDKYFDPESKKFYTGVYVSAYISKGAQDTWEKVLDGTLSGFSIGGRMNKYEDAFDEKMDKTIRIIKEYDLIELSLVDNPANQFANILSVQKVDGVDMIKGDTLDTEFENVFWDGANGIVKVSSEDLELSPIDGTPMKNIGFVEKNDDEKTKMIKFLVDSAKGINLSKMTKEEDPMNETTEDVVKNDDVVAETEVAPEADATTEVAEEAADVAVDDVVEEVAAEEPAVEDAAEKADTVASEEVAVESDVAEVSKSEEIVAEAVAEIRDGIATAFSDLTSVVKSLNDEIAELKKSLGLVNAKLNDAENDFNNIGKRIDAVEADTAFRKSGDLGEIVQEQPAKQVEKSLWGGRFLKTADLFN
jgi:Putative phage serine protease XkdF